MKPTLEQFEIQDTGKPVSGASTRPLILVAEDNMINQALMEAQLEVIGYEADYATNGIEALNLWREGHYNMLLTDIRMPEMDGYELTHKVRLHDKERGKKSSIIAISANALESDTQRCFDVGVDEVISKPVELEKLREALEEWNPKNLTVDIDVTESLNKRDNRISDTNDTRQLPNAIDLKVLEQSVGANIKVHRRLLTAFSAELPTEVSNVEKPCIIMAQSPQTV